MARPKKSSPVTLRRTVRVLRGLEHLAAHAESVPLAASNKAQIDVGLALAWIRSWRESHDRKAPQRERLAKKRREERAAGKGSRTVTIDA